MPTIAALAQAQLDAYNAADLDRFCACYHAQIRVLDAAGACTLEGIEAFRLRYAAMFERFEQVQAQVPERLSVGEHCVDLEHYSRVERSTGQASSGTVLVRYSLREDKIGVAQFFT